MELSVATINLRHNADRWHERRHLLVAQLAEAAPDLASLQEVWFPIRQGEWLRDRLNRLLDGDRPYSLILKRKQGALRRDEGIGILTRLPVLRRDWAMLGTGGRVALRAQVEAPGGQPLDFVALHLHHVREDGQRRLEQVQRMLAWLSGHRPAALRIVAGDFNETPDGAAIAAMKAGHASACATANGREPAATFPTPLVTREDGWSACLDYIFLSAGLGVVVQAGTFCDRPAASDPRLLPSDHRGLLALIDVRGREEYGQPPRQASQ